MRTFLLGWILAGVGAANAQAPASPDLLEASRSFLSGLIEVTQSSRASGGKLDDAARAKIRTVSERVDMEKLSQASLGAARWKGLKAADREEFRSLLQRLLETVIYPAARNITTSPTALKYEAVKGKGDQVRVSGEIEREQAGEKISQPLSIVLVFDRVSAKVRDAILDKELVSLTFKRQFDKALQKQKFSQVLETLRKRIAEAESGAK